MQYQTYFIVFFLNILHVNSVHLRSSSNCIFEKFSKNINKEHDFFTTYQYTEVSALARHKQSIRLQQLLISGRTYVRV
jgi:hypothetical protein